MVVLAMDQTGHGYSGGEAFSNGFGGPAGLAYLRSLPMVDRSRIGLEGHSMGGWTVLAAAAGAPDAAIALIGSSQYFGVINMLTFSRAQEAAADQAAICLLYTSPSPRDRQKSRMPSSA